MTAPQPTPSTSATTARAAAQAVSPVPTGLEVLLIVLALGAIVGIVTATASENAGARDGDDARTQPVDAVQPVSILPTLGIDDLRALVWTRAIDVDLRGAALRELETRIGSEAAVIEALRVVRQETSPPADFVAFIVAHPTSSAAPLLVDAMASQRIGSSVWEADIAPAWAATLDAWAHVRMTRAPARVHGHSSATLSDASLAASVLARTDPAALVERTATFFTDASGASAATWSLATATAQECAHAAALTRALAAIEVEPFNTSAWRLLTDTVLPAAAAATDAVEATALRQLIRAIAIDALDALARLAAGPFAARATLVRADLIAPAVAALTALRGTTVDADLKAALHAHAAALALR